jgi:type III pantothenate kinase
MMATLIIDIGNTALKAAWADGITLGKTYRYQGERMTEFILTLVEKEKPALMVLSSVRRLSRKNVARLEQSCDRLIVVDDDILEKHSLPLSLTPDRAASIIAARYLFKGKGCTIFDLGAMMTVDFLDSEGNFTGGCISPGCMTRFKSVNRYSKNLPLLSMPEDFSEKGLSIHESIYSGIISGIMFEIKGHICENPKNITVFTGGDANYFAKRMKNSIFVVCNIVLIGLAIIALGYDKTN